MWTEPKGSIPQFNLLVCLPEYDVVTAVAKHLDFATVSTSFISYILCSNLQLQIKIKVWHELVHISIKYQNKQNENLPNSVQQPEASNRLYLIRTLQAYWPARQAPPTQCSVWPVYEQNTTYPALLQISTENQNI